MRISTLTSEEQIGLRIQYGFADGHAYQDLNPSQEKIVANLPEYWGLAAQSAHHDIENEFASVFFRAANQTSRIGDKRFVISTTASQSIDLIGRWAKKNNIRISMIEPTFDNLPLLLKRWSVLADGISEVSIKNELTGALNPDRFDALFLVLPNNPTGYMMSESDFRSVVEWCDLQGKPIIIDACFRFYVLDYFDIFEILETSGITYLVIEDTGKTWPLLDMKASILSSSSDIIDEIRDLYSEIFLCVSPFNIKVITKFVEQSIKDGFDNSLRSIVAHRRALLRAIVAKTDLSVPEDQIDNRLPVEWLKIPPNCESDVSFVSWLRENGIACLPGRHFFWETQGSQVERYVRFSLLKPEGMVAAGMKHLGDVLDRKYSKTAAELV